MSRRLPLALAALVALAAGAFAFWPAPTPVSDPRLETLRDSMLVLAGKLSQARSQTLAELSLRQAAQADLARLVSQSVNTQRRIQAQTDSARRVLADTAATLQTLRLTLHTQVALTDTLNAALGAMTTMADTLAARLAREDRARAIERAASDSVIATQAATITTLSTPPPPCRILKRLACPSRTQAGLIGSTLTLLLLLVA